jgi:quinol monooxygenase YgiN
MYARLVQTTAKPGHLEELNSAVRERVLPILRQQAGFVDALSLVSDTDGDQWVGIALWKSKEDCDKYVATQAPKILESIRHLLQGEPIIRTFNVETSTSHDVGVERAASTT